ncbi:MAG: hypothetical protein IT562_06890 [Alphaproteobacteria bacterium]|nr:hypothetical protein [Alphaproteobacteria bacterium]
MARKLFEIVKTYELEPIVPDVEGAEPFRFRIEVRRAVDGKLYQARVYRIESLRVQPSFSARDGAAAAPADHEMIVADDHVGAATFEGGSAEEVRDKVLARIDAVFGPTGGRTRG